MKSLQGRLLALVLAAVLLVWGAAVLWTWRDASHELDELLDGHLAQAAALLVVQQTAEPPDEDDGGVYAPKLHRYAPRVAFQVWHEGKLSMRSSNAPAAPMHSGRLGQQAGFHSVDIDGTPWRVFATVGAERDVQVYVGERIDARESILRALLRGTLAPLALALPLLGLAVWWAVRHGLRPLHRLSATLRTRRPHALDPVLLPQAPAEMQPMLKALNGLLDRIGGMVESERRFTADAAHELRTPLAAVRAQAQVALAEPDESLRRHALTATVQGCDRATHLVEQLLMLSRLESGAAPASAVVDLATLARRVVGELAPAALARGQNLSVQGARVASIRGDETLLAVLLRNLVDNASRYSPDGAAVQVSVAVDGPLVRVTVQDDGPGLAAADRARLGERFFRVLGTGASGSGLGWSIVRRIAAAHGATVQVDTASASGGLRVTVAFGAA